MLNGAFGGKKMQRKQAENDRVKANLYKLFLGTKICQRQSR
jgi:hypothetical protein